MNIYVAKRKERNGSRLVRELLRYGFREMYGEDMPEIAKTEKGKPYFPSRPDVFFSLSHTDTHVMCAIGDEPVGCDIQTIRPVSQRVRRRVCGREDIDPEGFFTVWTAKESVIKYYGKNDWSFSPVGSREELSEAFPDVDFCFFRIDDCVAAVCAGKNAVFPVITEVDI